MNAFRMNPSVWLISLFCLGIEFQGLSNQLGAQEPVKLAETQFKNLKVLGKSPADQMGKVMNIASASLGVNCNHCHQGTDFASEAPAMKEEARRMFAMTMEINAKHFQGRPVVTCFTCHQGSKVPEGTVSLSLHSIPKKETPKDRQAKSPTVQEVLDRYVEALGGEELLSKIGQRKLVGERVEPHGARESEVLIQTSSGLSHMTTRYGAIVIREGYDGKNSWKRVNERVIDLKIDEGDQIRREAILASGLGIAKSYDELKFIETRELNGISVHLLQGKSFGRWDEELYFETQSGFLVRRICSIPTVLGSFEYQVDYSEYVTFDRIKQPTRLRFAVPNISWNREIHQVESREEVEMALLTEGF